MITISKTNPLNNVVTYIDVDGKIDSLEFRGDAESKIAALKLENAELQASIDAGKPAGRRIPMIVRNNIIILTLTLYNTNK